MTEENINKIADTAWERLYSRLNEDGLLTENTYSEKKKLHLVSVKWVAAIAVVCISIAVAFMIRNSDEEQHEMLTLNNDESGSVLISTLEDGSVVYLSSASTIQYPTHFEKDKREVFLHGDAYFDISKNKEKPFIIDTKHAVIEVLGTAFNVKSNGNRSFSLSVRHGKVKVTSKIDNRSVYVDRGETALFDTDNLYKIPTTNIEQFTAYTKKIHFKDERLADIVRVINMNGDSVQLQVDPQIQDRLLTVSFSNDTPLSITELICLAMNLEYIQENNTILIRVPK